MIKLYSKEGLEKLDIKKYSYNGVFMGESFITFSMNSHKPIDFKVGDYVKFRGETYELNYTPAKTKGARVNSTGQAFAYDNVKLNSLSNELVRCDFLDLVQDDNKLHYSGTSNFSFYANSVKDLLDRIQVNLDRDHKGIKAWTITVSPDADLSKEANISADTISCWDALGFVQSEFDLSFTIKERTILIGSAGLAVGRVFGYGKGKGFFDIQQRVQEESTLVTRLRAFGSRRNMGDKYYNKLTNASGKPYLPALFYAPELRLPSFPAETLDPYIDSSNIGELGVREGTLYFNGEEGREDIYPTLEGMTKELLLDAGVVIQLPVGDNGKVDEALRADNPIDDGEIKENNKLPSTFKIYLKDLGFNLAELDADGQYKYATTDTMQISMKSGMCIARTFDIIEKGIKRTTSSGYPVYEVICNRFTDESTSMAYPNSNWKILSGDRFVILGIDMPKVYKDVASQKLLKVAQKAVEEVSRTKMTYVPSIDKVFMANNQALSNTIKEGQILNFDDTDLNIDAGVIIQTLKIQYNEDAVPTYEITLSEDKVMTTIQKMQSSIDNIIANHTGGNYCSVKSLIETIGSATFLSKKFNDEAQGLIKFFKGIDVGAFESGTLGAGATLRMNDKDQSYLEVDKLYVRMQAVFTELLIEKLSHIGGQLVLSPAEMKCIRVDEIDNIYRCYFDTGENGEVVQLFTVGDQARCQVFKGSKLKYYWRLVEAIGDDYIDLSKTDYDGADIPEEGDHIIQLGHRTDLSRQNAQVLSSFGEDAPSYKQYQGINSYSLSNKQKTVISPSGNEFDGKVTIKEGSLGWENLVGLPNEFQNLATGTVNLLRNTGFTGDFESKRLEAETKLESKTEMFSERLQHWTGYGIVNEDLDSQSRYSVTLSNQTLVQPISTIFTENYIVSFKAKGNNIQVDASGFAYSEQLTSDYKRYVVKFKAGDTKLFAIGGSCTICEIMLERGTIASDWSASPLDNNKSLEEFQSIRYITDAVKNGSTSILGGLILSSMIQLGNYVNGDLKRVTSGISGIYNDDDDVSYWAGGTLEQAILAVLDPKKTSNVAQAVITHGGTAILNKAIVRGTVHATDGEFNGMVSIADGKILLNKDGSGQLANGNVKWDVAGNVSIQGKFESSFGANKVVIDPATNELQLHIGNKLAGRMYAYTDPYFETPVAAFESMITISGNEYKTIYSAGIIEGQLNGKRSYTIGNNAGRIDIKGTMWGSTSETGRWYVENGFVKIK